MTVPTMTPSFTVLGLLLLMVLSLVNPSLSDSSYYCAAFESDDVNGYFQMQHTGQGVAYYTLGVDLLSGFNASTCDLSGGLQYHIHTVWKNTSTYGSVGATYCGSSYTGSHYDPNLACSSKSQYYDSRCVSLGRTSDDSYDYACTTEIYAAGSYALCEVGDLSGKLGVVYETYSGSQQFNQSVAVADYQPPYEANFDASDTVSGQWASLVVHCAADGSRLACGQFIKQTEPCPTIVFNGTASAAATDDAGSLDSFEIALIAIGCIVIIIFLVFAIWYSWVLARPEHPYMPVPRA